MSTHAPFDVETIDIPAWRRDLVYVDYRDDLSSAAVDLIIHGEWPDDIDEWISDMQWQSAHEIAADLFAEIDHDPTDDETDALVERLIDLDTSNPYRDLMRHTGHMLFRFSPSEDDMSFLSDELDDPQSALEALNLPAEFLPFVAEILPEIAGYRAEGGGCFGATFVFSAHPDDLWPDEANGYGHGAIMVSDPFLWLTNPWSGNGYGVVAEGTTVTLPLEDVHVDSKAFGYGADDVFGGLILPDSTILPVPAYT